MFFLELVTRHFTFHAFADSRQEAYKLLRRGVVAHLREYAPHMTQLQAVAQSHDLYSNDDVREVQIQCGQVLRDYEPLDIGAQENV